MAARPLRLTAVEQAVAGKPRSEETATAAGELAITGATALRTAIMAIKAGEADYGLAFGVEKESRRRLEDHPGRPACFRRERGQLRIEPEHHHRISARRGEQPFALIQRRQPKRRRVGM